MLVEDAQMRDALKKIVLTMANDPALQDDLMQEGLIRLWKAETESPGRTKSWYLQNCRFRVQHCLALGRSVDSLKRNNADNRIPLQGDDQDEANLGEYHTNGSVLDYISFRDLVSVLSHRLNRRERVVLDGLAEGLRLREVASKCRLSYPTALKYRRRIAALATKLGIPKPVI